MTSNEIRKAFFEFFEAKGHKIVPSAPIVRKDDPTLMFTNAGMNQFKDIFLGIKEPQYKRVANSQKCLRVSGKHNDLEQVGKDTYHHTMFEMLGNWSFGDYFKEKAIDYAWEFLTKTLKIDPDRLYATVFGGDKETNLEADIESKNFWKKYLPEHKILFGSKKDNFWEMGDIGPCGPCSEIHIDLRDAEERKKIPGEKLINKDHPEVIEIWNLVFIQFNRKKDGSLEKLPQKHVDTGMGFERLTMIVQGKKSNYDTDIFQPIIKDQEKITGLKYGEDKQVDIAMRVCADHIRAIAFSIADGQIPSNEKAGYVIRRILRRAVRYAFTFLNQKEPYLYKLLPSLNKVMGEQYPELIQQHDFIRKVIIEEENLFLKTLDTGISLLQKVIEKTKREGKKQIPGSVAFTLYDTYGFPLDLTKLILQEQGLTLNQEEYNKYMQMQKERSRNSSVQQTEDWIILKEAKTEQFVGYDTLKAEVYITRYRKVKIKNKEYYQLVFQLTPFYPEGGGQIGDTGYIYNDKEKIKILDTKKENNLIVHLTEKIPQNLNGRFIAEVDEKRRKATMYNHSATHLLHYALRKILGTHVEQRGSLVEPRRLRFDFSHFQKLSDEEIHKIENLVNEMIRANYPREEKRDLPFNEGIKMGAIALFGEKYGDKVRVIKFGPSIEFCGGTHVNATGEIGFFKITSETAIAAGIRRIEAITGYEAEKYVLNLENTVKKLKNILKTEDILKRVEKILEQNKLIQKQLENFEREKLQLLKNNLKNSILNKNGINYIIEKIDIDDAKTFKSLAYQLKGEIENLVLALGTVINNKPMLEVMISNNLVEEKNLDANILVKEAAKEIQGGGGGQKFFATAGGKNPLGINEALNKIKEKLGL